ncbi:MAG: Crp/Fnr family transcriptional regulator [Acidobacteriaceae bacterium]
MPLRKPLYDPGETPLYAYFLTSGIASVVTLMEDGAMAEVGLVGSEGLVGSVHLMGPSKIPTRCFVQLEGAALRIRFSDLTHAFREDPEFRERVLECVQEQTAGLCQLAGCNRLHDNEERLARWLLMAQDRARTDMLNFTQEFLAMMLGARRTTVTLIAGALQKRGLIRYQRGKVRILNRRGLEAASCDCYQVIKELYANLYSGAEHGTPEKRGSAGSGSKGKAGARKGAAEESPKRKVRVGHKVGRAAAKKSSKG